MDPSVYKSPKRKREEHDEPSMHQTSIFTNHFTRRASDAESTGGDQSPRTNVAGKFQRLDIRNNATSRIPFREAKPGSRNSPDPILEYSDQANLELHQPHHEGMFAFKAGQTTPMSISPPGSGDTSPSSSQRPKPAPNTGRTSPSPSPHHRHRTKRSPPLSAKHSKSPPPNLFRSSSSTESESEFWWSSSEITGWDPTDPDEDSYGVNGVGYQKTPAVAYSLSQKRKQQIAEYRSREAREARQRRSENRRSGVRIGLGGSRRGSPTIPTRVAPASALVAEEVKPETYVGMAMGNVTGGGNVRCVRFEVG